jgi:hypothetical protein
LKIDVTPFADRVLVKVDSEVPFSLTAEEAYGLAMRLLRAVSRLKAETVPVRTES